MGKVEQWAEKQGLELAADCHLARVVQAAHLLQARKNTAEDIASVSSICFKLNSVQLRTLLDLYEPSPDERPISREMIGKFEISQYRAITELAVRCRGKYFSKNFNTIPPTMKNSSSNSNTKPPTFSKKFYNIFFKSHQK